MNFTYYNYRDNILKNILTETPKVYVFDSVKDKEYSKSFYRKKFGEKESLFFTFSELKETIFLTNKIVLREEKPALVFYNCLSKSNMKKLKVSNYYDVIDTAYNFNNFYKELKEYKINKIEGLEEWQSEFLNILDDIKIEYDNFLDINNYTLQYLQEEFTNLNLSLISDYSEIEFVNILKFTPFEKDILNKLKNSFNINFSLQISKGDFDENKFELIKVTTPNNLNISILETKDASLQLVNLISCLKENSTIIDQNILKSNYDKLISSNKIKMDKKITLEDTKIFEFMTLWHELLRSVEFINNEFCLHNKVFLNCLNNKNFKKYYEITDTEYNYFFKFIENDYKYVSAEVLQNGNIKLVNLENSEKLIHIINDIHELYKLNNIQGYTHFIEKKISPEILKTKLDDNYFAKTIYDNNIAKFYEALSEVLSIEDMDILKNQNWSHYFSKDKISENLLKLILKYLREKSINTIEENMYEHFIISPENYENRNCDNLIYININNETMPTKPRAEFLLTDKQREHLGLPSNEKNRLFEKYKFFRNLFSAEKSLIFSIKNEDKNIDRSSFLEELILNYNLRIKQAKYSDENISSLINNIFESEKGISQSLIRSQTKNFKLLFSELDYQDKTLNLGSYDYNLMMKCYYRFFLNKVAGLQHKEQDISYKIDPKLLGLIIHSIFEKLSIIKEKDIKNGNFEISISEIESLLKNELSMLKYKLPVNFNKYYQEILFPIFIKNAKLFYDNLSKILGNDSIHNFSSEKGSKAKDFIKDKININLTGRLDLLIETDKKKFIVDYKTGKGDPGQLDFYSILLYNNANEAEKLIYNAWDGNFIIDDRSEDKILSKDLLHLTLIDFINKGYYKRTDKKSECMKCEYIDICRQRWEDDE